MQTLNVKCRGTKASIQHPALKQVSNKTESAGVPGAILRAGFNTLWEQAAGNHLG